MTAKEIKELVIDILEFAQEDEGTETTYTDKEFLRHLNQVLRHITLDMINKDLTSYVNLKKVTFDLTVTNTPGTRGYQGMYKLPKDILQMRQVHISLDGNCWIEGTFTPKKVDFDYKCNDCPCEGAQCGINLRKVGFNGSYYIQVRPIPTVPVKKGLVVQYEALPEKIKDLETEMPFNEVDQDYVANLVADKYMEIHFDMNANGKRNKFFSTIKKSKKDFDKLHGLQTKHRIQRHHTRPSI